MKPLETITILFTKFMQDLLQSDKLVCINTVKFQVNNNLKNSIKNVVGFITMH